MSTPLSWLIDSFSSSSPFLFSGSSSSSQILLSTYCVSGCVISSWMY